VQGDGHRIAAVVLAAGEGKRLRSDLPKVLHRIAGQPLLAYAVGAVRDAGVDRTVVVASKRRDEIDAALTASGYGALEYVVQDPPRGTGDAARVGLESLGEEVGTVLVTVGDFPLLRGEALREMLAVHGDAGIAATMMTAQAPPESDYGRVVRDASGRVVRIVEVRDAAPDELAISEVNSGVFVFSAPRLRAALAELSPHNSQGEYYLTDVIGLFVRAGEEVATYEVPWEDTKGVNDRVQLAEAAAVLRRRAAERWMREGVTIVDPSSTFIDPAVSIGRDAVIQPFTFLEGKTEVAAEAEVGPQTRIIDSTVGERATVTFAVVRSSEIGPDASVGPFASLRPGTKLARGSKLGTFVESKNISLGEDSKANHLAYLGDAEIGTGVNIGAGTITCNWDGHGKHSTVIDDDAYIASDTMLVAPVRIGKRGATGAGAVVRGDVPDDALAVGVPARIIEGKGDKMGKRDTAAEPEDT